jgi:hypothetical protein
VEVLKNGKSVYENKNVKGIVSHENNRFYASDNYLSASDCTLSQMKIAEFNRKLEDENECEKNVFGLFG